MSQAARPLATAEKMALEGANGSQDSQILLEMLMREHGVGMVSHSKQIPREQLNEIQIGYLYLALAFSQDISEAYTRSARLPDLPDLR